MDIPVEQMWSAGDVQGVLGRKKTGVCALEKKLSDWGDNSQNSETGDITVKLGILQSNWQYNSQTGDITVRLGR